MGPCLSLCLAVAIYGVGWGFHSIPTAWGRGRSGEVGGGVVGEAEAPHVI